MPVNNRKRQSPNIEQENLEDRRVKTGPKFSSIWNHFDQGNSIGSGHYQATCKYCGYFFKQGRPHYLRTHILSYCAEVDEDAKRSVNQEILENENLQPLAKKAKVTGQKQISSYYDSEDIEPFRQKEIEQALTMMFICCGVSFRIVENPFFINLLKALNPGFVPPSREVLSGRLMDTELARVNKNIEKDLRNAKDLTIGI
jgi:hypothetical protein